MLSTVRGIFRDGRVELQEPAPPGAARVLVTFLSDEEVAGEQPDERRATVGGDRAAALKRHPAWPQDLVDFLVSPPDPLIEREQPAEPERKDLGL